jgi:penicillin-insensitive murein DD-endopeptidase
VSVRTNRGLVGLSLTLGAALALVLVMERVHADAANNPWAKVSTPSKGAARAIGDYSSGCMSGAAKLAFDGPGYQVMHPSRLRYFGHPELIDFIAKLGRALKAEGLADLMVGDLSQPRGGPASGGHSSHQIGLDVDLWYWQPKAAAKRALTQEERENTKARSVLDGKIKAVREEHAPRVATLLRLTASDPRVTRIFVHPIIKRELCQAAESDRAWLRKVRPWFGHDDHFHVRLACPDGNDACIPQAPVPSGDGCGELDWWFDEQAQADRDKGRATYQSKVGKAAGMPAECGKLLESQPQHSSRSGTSDRSAGAAPARRDPEPGAQPLATSDAHE